MVNINIEQLKTEYEVFFDSKAHKIVDVIPIDPHIQVKFENPRRDFDPYVYNFDAKTLVALDYEREDVPVRIRKKARSVVRDVWWLRFGNSEWAKDDWIDYDAVYSIKEAQEKLAAYKANLEATNSPFRVRLRKDTETADVYDYDQWAEARFATSEWTPVPWANEPWADKFPHHFAHLSKYDGTIVAFWDSPETAQRDQIETLNAGRYLKRFYSDVLTDTQIEQWVIKMDPPGDLVFSGKDPEAIYNAYDNKHGNMHSCMVYRDDQNCHDGVKWRSGKNPVRVYGGGDLEVVSLVRRGEVVARALCWPEKEAFGRCYGDVNRLMSALKAKGWTHDGDGSNNMDVYGEGLFEGARILKIRPPRYPHNWVMPYVDFHYGVEDQGDHFVLTRQTNEYCFRTDGLRYAPDSTGCECDRCGADLDTEEDDTFTVDGNTWCYYCWDNHARSCDRCGVCVEETNDVDGQDWCDSCVSRHAIDCSYCSDPFPTADLTVVRDQTDPYRTRHCCEHCTQDETNVTEVSGVTFHTATMETENEPA